MCTHKRTFFVVFLLTCIDHYDHKQQRFKKWGGRRPQIVEAFKSGKFVPSGEIEKNGIQQWWCIVEICQFRSQVRIVCWGMVVGLWVVVRKVRVLTTDFSLLLL